MLSGFQKKSENCIYKFAVTPKNISEERIILNDLKEISNDYLIIGIAMGEISVYSRLFGDRFGSLCNVLLHWKTALLVR